MSQRLLILLFSAAAVISTAVHAAAQSPSKASAWTAPRTPDGHPDLQGVWTNATLTPFERPAELAGKEFFTKEEAAAFAKKLVDNTNRDKRGATPEEDVAGAYNEAFFDRATAVASNLRTSVVTEPADGKVPALTPAARDAAAKRLAIQRRLPESAEDFTLPVRCIVWGTSGPPMVQGPYNNNYQIVQTRDYVAIEVEMIHDMRIIPLDGRPHLPSSVRQWLGDSVGHWEGDTLVVDTTNFTDKTHFRGSDENLHVVERFTRIGPNAIRYRFTVDDPTAFTKPWAGEIIMGKSTGAVYEYACHEGNYSLTSMLSGARAEEASKTKSK